MTKGNIGKQITYFALPILLGLIVQQIYALSDTVIVGQYYGENGISAIGTTGSISNLIVSLGAGSTAGFAIIIAQKFGSKDYQGLKKSVGNSIVLTIIIALILTTIALIFSKVFLNLLLVPTEIFNDSLGYINAIYFGIFFVLGYNLITSILRSIGDSIFPLIFLCLSAVINIGLDLLFIAVFKFGIPSAGYATIISQGISAVVSFIYGFIKFPLIRLKFNDFILEKKEVLLLLGNGLPMGFQYSIINIGLIAIQRTINGFATREDTSIIASFTFTSKIDGFLVCPFNGLSIAMASFCGQNYGAKNFERLKKGIIFTTIIGVFYSFIATLVIFFFGIKFIPLMVNEQEITPNLIYYTSLYFKINPWFFIPLLLILLYRNALQGMGDNIMPLFGGLLELVSRVGIAIGLPFLFGYYALYISNPVTWILTSILFTIRLIFFMKRVKIKFERDLIEEGLLNETKPSSLDYHF